MMAVLLHFLELVHWHYWTIRFYVGRPVLVPPHPTHIPTQLGFALHDEW